MSKKILFLVPYPLRCAASQRFRFEQYFAVIENQGIVYSVESFLTADNWKIFFESGRPFAKFAALLNGLLRRIAMLFRAGSYDFIFIHREVAPVGPPIFEWVLSKALKKKIVYDFDDAIWLSDELESKIVRFVKWRSKVSNICSWAHKVSCGNTYLATYAFRFNKRTIVNPTTIDTEYHHNLNLVKFTHRDQITIGWTGTHSTLKYLNGIEDVLARLESKFKNIKFMVIADKAPKLELASYEFITWNESSEISDLLKFDIGIMPLPDDKWARGKCGFKLLQYMALEIPAVASPIGVNTEMIIDGVDGYLASTIEAWENSLTQLINDQILRKEMGRKGRTKVINNYSVSSNTSNFSGLFD